MRRTAMVSWLLVLPAMAPAPVGAAVRHSFVEDFSTTLYRHPTETTADWNTMLGQIGLPGVEPRLMGGASVPGMTWAAETDGDRLFLAVDAAGLKLYDISNPDAPVSRSGLPTFGGARDLDVEGEFIYVACRNAGIQVFRMTGTWSFASVATLDIWYGASRADVEGIFVEGDSAYVAAGSAGLVIVDVTDPLHPRETGRCDTPGKARQVVVDGDYAYVADTWQGLQVVDLSVPGSPAIVAGLYSLDMACDVAVAGDYAYVADMREGLLVYGIRNPRNPTMEGRLDTPGYAWGVDVSGEHAYLADGSGGFASVNVTDPRHPQSQGRCAVPGFARSLALDGSRAYVAAMNGGVQVVRVSIDKPPAWLWTDATPDYAWDMAVAGNRLFLGTGAAGLLVYDITHPESPARIGQAAPVSYMTTPSVAGNYVFVTDESKSPLIGYLTVVDVTNPSAPVRVTSLALPAGALALGVTVVGNYAYVAGWHAGLLVVDVSRPTSPRLVAMVNLPEDGEATRVDIAGNYAYVSDYDSRNLAVVDITNPRAPVYRTFIDLGERVWDAQVHGNCLFVAAGGTGLVVLDITNPASPVWIATRDTPHFAYGLEVSGNTLYVCDYESGLRIYDITDPWNPTFTTNVDTPGSCLKAVACGDVVFVGDYAGGLKCLRMRTHGADPTRNIGRSLPVDTWTADIRRVKLDTDQVEQVTWKLSANGGATWQDIVPDGAWNVPGHVGSDLVWRSTHTMVTEANPVCTEVRLDWLYDAPIIDSIADVGRDEGGQVRVRWTRSSHDFPGDATPILQYALYRRIDPFHAPASRAGGGDPALVEGVFLTPASTPGEWELVALVPARCEDRYAMVAATLADSLPGDPYYSAFLVTAMTASPSVWFESPPDSGCSFDNSLDAGPAERAEGMRPTGPVLHPAVPNPFTGSTRIPWSVPAGTESAVLRIFDLRGRLVREYDLNGAVREEGATVWDGRDDSGRRVAPGVYFCRLAAGGAPLHLRIVRLE